MHCWPCIIHLYTLFTYCNHVWGSTYATSLKPLLLLQKRSVQIITFSGYRDHTDPLFYELGLLKISDINKYVLGKFMYRWYTKQIPCLFNSLFQTVRDVHEYDNRQSCHLHISIVKTNLGKCKLSYNGRDLWNNILKANINAETSEAVFAKTLNTLYCGCICMTTKCFNTQIGAILSICDYLATLIVLTTCISYGYSHSVNHMYFIWLFSQC